MEPRGLPWAQSMQRPSTQPGRGNLGLGSGALTQVWSPLGFCSRLLQRSHHPQTLKNFQEGKNPVAASFIKCEKSDQEDNGWALELHIKQPSNPFSGWVMAEREKESRNGYVTCSPSIHSTNIFWVAHRHGSYIQALCGLLQERERGELQPHLRSYASSIGLWPSKERVPFLHRKILPADQVLCVQSCTWPEEVECLL